MNTLRHTMLKPHGHTIIIDPDNGIVEFDTMACVCCRRHINFSPHIHRTMGWCAELDGPVCADCVKRGVVHWEQRLENREAGRDWHHKPSRISMSKA